MPGSKKNILILAFIGLVLGALTVYWLSGIDRSQIQYWLERTGIWAPILYIAIYIVSTLFLLPSTALNLLSGAVFGPLLGMGLTTIAAILSGMIAFIIARTMGLTILPGKLPVRLQIINAEIRQGGALYMFAICLFPVFPYGLVNLAAGLSSIRFKDYILGLSLGTLLGVSPFVFLGSTGLKALRTGEILPLIGSLMLIGSLVIGANWYRRRRKRDLF
jgi:uncharacterized membrane protein YdjX (TVP38/TMEM64 family)